VKVRDLRKAKGIIGNKFKQLAELSEIELRVIELIGLDIEGSKDCAENIPNEEVHTYTRTRACAHTHTYIYIYIYIFNLCRNYNI